GADMELRRLRAEGVARDPCRFGDAHPERAGRAGGPDAAVLLAERAGAGARRDLCRLRAPVEREGDVAAVAPTSDQHRFLPCASAGRRAPPRFRSGAPESTSSGAAAAPSLAATRARSRFAHRN